MTSRSNAAEVEYLGGDAALAASLTEEVENDSAPVTDLLLQADVIEAGDVALDEYGVRRLLRRLAYLGREVATLRALKRQITQRYDGAMVQRVEEADEIRRLLTIHLSKVDGGKVKIPDVGTAYLSRRQPKLEVEDAEAFEEWALATFGDEVTVTMFDEVGARAKALANAINGDGEIPPGTVLVPERREASVRAAS